MATNTKKHLNSVAVHGLRQAGWSIAKLASTFDVKDTTIHYHINKVEAQLKSAAHYKVPASDTESDKLVNATQPKQADKVPKTNQQQVLEKYPQARAEWVDGVVLILAGTHAGGTMANLLGRGHTVCNAWNDAAQVIDPTVKGDGW